MLVKPVNRIFGADPAEYDNKGGQAQYQTQEIDQGGPFDSGS